MVTKLLVYIGDSDVDAFKSFKDFEESDVPCNSCLVQATCVVLEQFNRISFTPCNKIVKYLDELDSLVISYTSKYNYRILK